MSSVAKQLGVSDDDYEWLCDLGHGVCWICANEERTDRRMAIDHDHVTGAVRGLLCTSCNRRLGGTRDPKWLRRAALYLESAARAFGDQCDACGEAAPSHVVGDGIHEHRCCGKRWRVGYQTNGVPFAWSHYGVNPAPPRRAPLDGQGSVGHPGSGAGYLRALSDEMGLSVTAFTGEDDDGKDAK
jgi:hypothetical protein